MKTLFPHLILLIFFPFIFSCSDKDEKITPVLKVDKSTINAEAAADVAYIDITSNIDWDLSGIPSWLQLDATSGNGNARVEISYTANTSADLRSVTLIMNGYGVPSERIKFTQMGAQPLLLTDKTNLEELPEGQLDSVLITSNIPWKIVMPINSFWISPGASSGKAGTTKLYFTVAANNRVGSREADIRVESAGHTATPVILKMTQAQPEVKITSFTPKAKGEATITIRGSGFSSMQDENSVTINGKDAAISMATVEELRVTVPLAVGTGKIEVRVGTKSTVSANNFEYEPVWRALTIAGNDPSNPLEGPAAVAMGEDGNFYVADRTSQKIWKITPGGNISTLAGSGVSGFQDGPGNTAMFDGPAALAVDVNNIVYVADRNNKRIRKIMPDGTVSTLAGNGTVADFNSPSGITIGPGGNLYVADYGSHRIRMVTSAGIITTFAGSGTAGYKDGNSTAAIFTNPSAICTDANGTLYVTEPGVRRIRKIESSGNVSTIVNGTSNDPFTQPAGITCDNAGNIFVTDQLRHSIFQVSNAGAATIIAGQVLPGYADGEGIQAKFNLPVSVFHNKNGELIIADFGNRKIRKLAKL
jgi:hypothetical protein